MIEKTGVIVGLDLPEKAEHSREREVVMPHKWVINPSMGSGNHSATSNNMKLVHWPLMGGLLHLVQQGGRGLRRLRSRPVPSLLYQM